MQIPCQFTTFLWQYMPGRRPGKNTALPGLVQFVEFARLGRGFATAAFDHKPRLRILPRPR